MPLRDHFRPPVANRHSWEGLHGGWPMAIVQNLFPKLPPGYVAAPSVHLGTAFEVDVSVREQDEPLTIAGPEEVNGGVAIATRAPPKPTLALETDLPDYDEYEVRIYDEELGQRLVAAIELVSPANKDRPQSRRAFVEKVSALLQRGVSVSVVDLVTVRQFNLYAELLELLEVSDPALPPQTPGLYAVTLRGLKRPRRRSVLESWYHPMQLGQPLPTLPVCLEVDVSIDLELESSYEEACRVLRIS
ncbi:MAG: DUF4058 family protein [Planctomycetales bacterium]